MAVRLGHPGARCNSKRVSLTKRGYAAAETIRATVRRIERELKRELGAGEFERLRELLTKLNETALVRGPQA